MMEHLRGQISVSEFEGELRDPLEIEPKFETWSVEEEETGKSAQQEEAILGIEDSVYNDDNDNLTAAMQPKTVPGSTHLIFSWKCGICTQRFDDRLAAVQHVKSVHKTVGNEAKRPNESMSAYYRRLGTYRQMKEDQTQVQKLGERVTRGQERRKNEADGQRAERLRQRATRGREPSKSVTNQQLSEKPSQPTRVQWMQDMSESEPEVKLEGRTCPISRTYPGICYALGVGHARDAHNMPSWTSPQPVIRGLSKNETNAQRTERLPQPAIRGLSKNETKAQRTERLPQPAIRGLSKNETNAQRTERLPQPAIRGLSKNETNAQRTERLPQPTIRGSERSEKKADEQRTERLFNQQTILGQELRQNELDKPRVLKNCERAIRRRERRKNERTETERLPQPAIRDPELSEKEADEQRTERLLNQQTILGRELHQNELDKQRVLKNRERAIRGRERRKNETEEQRAQRLLARYLLVNKRRPGETEEEHAERLRERAIHLSKHISLKERDEEYQALLQKPVEVSLKRQRHENYRNFARRWVKPPPSSSTEYLESTEECQFCGEFVIRKYMLLHCKYHFEIGTAVVKPKVPKTSNAEIDKQTELFKCGLCDKSFHQEFLLQMHQKQEHNPETHNCRHCDKVFKNVAVLNKHKTKSHPEIL